MLESIRRMPQSDVFQYNMNYPSLGQCVIINNKNCHKQTGMGVRNGTDRDAENVKETFSKLGFKIKTSHDQTVSQMRDVLTKASQEDHSHSAMFVCVLLSHGDDGVIFGTDGCIELKELFKLFRGDCCKSLVGKPKLFFIQKSIRSFAETFLKTRLDLLITNTGSVRSELARHLRQWHARIVLFIIGHFWATIPVSGSQRTLYCALQGNTEHLSGQCFSDSQVMQVKPEARDDGIAKKLWDVSEKLCGIA
ncbi:hypothetical protein QQF64_006907 [Cirrhinus molitorella]|uniref:Caspase family p20 domain-containing protein n=1 Tax=Cirrhinus molitorella TaxID=172907 RepID=A0ABR3MCK1_9TELE